MSTKFDSCLEDNVEENQDSGCSLLPYLHRTKRFTNTSLTRLSVLCSSLVQEHQIAEFAIGSWLCPPQSTKKSNKEAKGQDLLWEKCDYKHISDH